MVSQGSESATHSQAYKHLTFSAVSFLSTVSTERGWRLRICFHLQFCSDEQYQGHDRGSGELAQLAHHGEAQVEESRPPERVGQAVHELGHEGGDGLAQREVGGDADDDHEDDGVLQDLGSDVTHDAEFALLLVTLVPPLLDLTQGEADGVQNDQGDRCSQVDVLEVLWVCALVEGLNCGCRYKNFAQ